MIKLTRTILGGTLVLLGMVFIIIPGPSLLLVIPGLVLLSLDYPTARKGLKMSQRLASKSARWLDQRIANRSYFR